MFGYQRCVSCGLYHLSKDLDNETCGSCLSKNIKLSYVPLSTPQYKKLCEERLNVVKYFLKPTLPCYPSDVLKEI